MFYSIATMKEVQSDIDLELDFNKSGDNYTVALSWQENGKRIFRHVTLQHDEARKRFDKLSNAILEGCYNLEGRIKILEGEI